MKNRVLFSIVTIVAFLASLSLAYAQDRSIDGSSLIVLSPANYNPGVADTWSLALVNGSVDGEAITDVDVYFPTDVTVNAGATALIQTVSPAPGRRLSISSYVPGTGVTLSWDWVAPYQPISAGGTATGTISVTVSPSHTGNLTIPYTISGNNVGAPNHSIFGNIVLPPPAPPASVDDIRVTIRIDGNEGLSGSCKIGTTIDIEADCTGEVTVTCDVSDFGGPTNLAMTPARDGTYEASYTILISPPVIDDADNYVWVTANNGYVDTTVQDDVAFIVDNEEPDFSANPPDLVLTLDQNGNTIADINDGVNVDELTFYTSVASVTGGDAYLWEILWNKAMGHDTANIPDGNDVTETVIFSGFSDDLATYTPQAICIDDAGNIDNGACSYNIPGGLDNIPPDVADFGGFTVTDRNFPPDDNTVADLNYDLADQIPFTLGTINNPDGDNWHIDTAGELTGNYDTPASLTRTVVAGTLDYVLWNPTIEVYDNAGNYSFGNVVPANRVIIDNVLPDTPADTWFDLVTRAFYASVGDVIQAYVDFNGHNVVSGVFDFWRLDPVAGGPLADPSYIIPGIIVGNVIHADYTVILGDLQYLPPGPGLGVDVYLTDAANNTGNFTFYGDPGDEMYVDAQPPLLGSDIYHTGYLRFSPESTPITGYTDNPDDITMGIILPDWNAPGGADRFLVRVEQEYTRAIIGTLTFSVALGNVNPGINPNEYYFSWDGTDPNDGVTPMPEGSYGFTLVSLTDAAMNERIVDQVVDPADPFYNPAAGYTLLNAVHGVLDNTEPEFLDELVVNGVPATIILSEDFEGGTIPPGWTQEFGPGAWGNYGWIVTDDGTSIGFNPPPHTYYAVNNSDLYGYGSTQEDYLITPNFTLDNSWQTAYLTFDLYFDASYGQQGFLLFRVNEGPWLGGGSFSDTGGNWVTVNVGISALIGQTNIQLGFLAVGSYSAGIAIDNVEIGGYDLTPISEIHRYIQDNDYSGTVTAGDVFLYVDNAFMYLAVTRAFTEDTELLRHEHIGYWIIIDNTTYGGTVTRYMFGDEDGLGTPATGPQGLPMAGYTEYLDEDQVTFGSILDVQGYVGLPTNIAWIADDTGGPLADGIFPAGYYDVTANIRDNAGNINQGVARATVEIIDHLYTPPTINNLVITSVHDGGPGGLPPYDPVNHNFYVDSYYGGNPLNPMYYDSDDLITFEVTFDDVTYIDYVEILDNAGYGFGTRVYHTTDPEFSGNVLTVTYDVSDIDMSFAALAPGIQYNIGHNMVVNGFEIVVYDVFLGSTITSPAIQDIYNLIIPEEPVWPTSSVTTVTLSDDRFSPGWYSHVYDCIQNPARDTYEDLVTVDIQFDFTPGTATKDFNWYLAIDNQEVDDPTVRFAFGDARFSRSGTFTSGGGTYNVPTITFYGLQNDITLDPIVDPLGTELLKVSVFAIAQGYQDDGYIDPPGLDETKVINDLWVDNTNPEILTETGAPLINWGGDPGFAGHIYDYEMAVSYAENVLDINFRTSEPLDDTPGNWGVSLCDYDGNPIPLPVSAAITSLVGSDQQTINGVTGYTAWNMEITLSGLNNAMQFLDCVARIIAPNDDAANPSHVNNPPYPYSLDPLAPSGDAYRFDSAEAYVRFMILREVPHLTQLSFAHEHSFGFANASGTTTQGWISNDGTFDFSATIENLVYLPTGVTRDISSMIDINFGALNAVGGEPTGTPHLFKDNDYLVTWNSVPFTDLNTIYSTNDIIVVPVSFDLIFTGVDAGHTYHEQLEIEIKADFLEPDVVISDPYAPFNPFRTDADEGTGYYVDVNIHDEHSGVFKYSCTLDCDDPDIAISGGPGPEPPIFFEDFDAGLPGDWTIVDGYNDGNTWFPTDGAYAWWYPAYGSYFQSSPSPFMVVDSDWAGWIQMNEILATPPINTVGADNLTLEMDLLFLVWSGNEEIVIEVWNGDSWEMIFNWPGYFGSIGGHLTVDVSALANIDFQVRVSYLYAYYDMCLAIDNVMLHNWGVRDDQVVTYQVIIPEDHDNRILNFTATCEDNVTNLGTGYATWDVTNVPQVDVADFDNLNPHAPNYLKDGDNAYLYIGIRDMERVDQVDISLNTDFTYPPLFREYFAPGAILSLTDTEFLALPTTPPGSAREGDRAVNPSWTWRYLVLENINAVTHNVPECGDIIATVTIHHPYSANDDSSTDTSEIGWLVVDNSAPVISNLTYTITELIFQTKAAVTITADIVDLPTTCTPSGVNPATIDLNLFGVDGFTHNYVTNYHVPAHNWDGTTATWNLWWPDDFGNTLSDPSDIDGIIHVNASDNLGQSAVEQSLQIDTKPEITDVQFYYDGNPTDILLPDDNGLVYVDVTVDHTVDHMDYVLIDRLFMVYNGGLVELIPFDSGAPDYAPTRDLTTTVFRFVPTFSFEPPVSGFEAVQFEFEAVSIYDFHSDIYTENIVIVDYPREVLYGVPENRVYPGYDPDGWFAPEHNVHSELTLWSPYALTLDDVIANYDYLGDFVDPWFNPDLFTETIHEFDFEPDGFVDITLYEYLFEWDVVTDAQSIWSLIIPPAERYPGEDFEPIIDGCHIPIYMEANLFWSIIMLPTKWIQVDMNDPGYATADGSEFYFYEEPARANTNGFDLELYLDDGGSLIPFYYWGGASYWDFYELTLVAELPYDKVPNFTESFVLRAYATDFTNSNQYPSIGGSGVDEIFMPTSADFDIDIYAPEPFGENGWGVYYQQWVLTPNFPINHGDVASLDLNEILDLCNHDEVLNPTVYFQFVADYDGVDTSELKVFDWKGMVEDPEGSGIFRPDWETSPYVNPGDVYSLSVPLDPFETRNTDIAAMYFNNTMFENYCVDTDEADLIGAAWVSMANNGYGLWYKDGIFGGVIHPDYSDGDLIYTQIMIQYHNGSTWTSDWIMGSRVVNHAIVDNIDPNIIEYGIEVWSETLGYEEEGYVCPDDRDGHIRITFDDNITEYEFGAIPDVWVRGLGLFVFGWNFDGIPYGGFYPEPGDFDFRAPNDNTTWINLSDLTADVYYDGVAGHWICELGAMTIRKGIGSTQFTMEAYIDDPVGNTSYDPLNPSTKFVEATADGPIVPVIVGTEVYIGDQLNPEVPYTQFVPNLPLNGWNDQTGLEFWIGEGNTLSEDVTIKVYVRAGYQAYIEDMWLDLSAFADYTLYEQVTDIQWYGPPYPNLWVGTFVLDNTMLAPIREDVTFTINTIRHPFGAIDVFTDELEVTLHVDTEDAQVNDAVVYNRHTGFETVEWSIDPDYGMTVMAVVGDLRGALGVTGDQDWPMPLPVDMVPWFYLQNDGVDEVFATDDPYYPTSVEYPVLDDRDDDYESALLYWDISPEQLDPYWWDTYTGEDETFDFDIHYRNRYSEWFVTNTDQFNGGAGVLVDNQAPVFASGYSYGANHEPNHTIVPYYPGGAPWDQYAYILVNYDDVNGLKYITSDWTVFGGSAAIVTYPYGPRATEIFEFVYNALIYANVPDLSMTGDVGIMLTDFVGNESGTSDIVTTFVFEENETFDPQIYPNAFFIYDLVNDLWYTKDGPVEMFADHTVMGFDTIDNDVDFTVDEPQEGLVFDPLFLHVNSHVNNDWYPFPHVLYTIGDMIIFALDDPYGTFTQGWYNIQVNTENIFGHELMNWLDFVVDQSSPYVTTIDLGDNSYAWNDIIVSNSDWEYIRVHVHDQNIYWEDRDFVPGVGVDFLTDEFNGEDYTYAVLTDGEGVPVPGLEMADYEGGDYVKIIPSDDRGWASDNLTSGQYYYIHVYTWDKLGNYAEYVKEFFYNDEPADIVVHIFDHNFIPVPPGQPLNVTDELAYIGASVDDEFGMVTEVAFDLFFDTNGNNIYDPGIDLEYQHLLGEPDNTVPYEATWNIMDLSLMSPTEYEEHINVYNYDGTSPVLDWFIHTTAYSNSNAVAELTTRVPVRDNVGPAPWLEDIIGNNTTWTGTHYNLEYDFSDPNMDNTSYIRGWCKYDSDMDGVIEYSDNNWPDAWYVMFYIEGPAYATPLMIGNIYQEPGSDRYIAFWDWNDVALDYPGWYTITAEGYDRVGNVAWSLNALSAHVFTRGNAYSEIAMVNFDVPNWDNEWPIYNWTEYGPLNPIQTILNFRQDAWIYNINEVQYFGFFYDVWDETTDTWVSSMNPCPNDTEINPDMPADASMIFPYEVEIIDNTGMCSIVVPEDVYRGAGYDENDYSYRWYILITDYAGNQYFEDVYNSLDQWFRVDYVAPVAYMWPDPGWEWDGIYQGDDNGVAVSLLEAENTPDEYADTYDWYDLPHALVYKWSYTGSREWNIFEPAGAPIFEYEDVNKITYVFGGWNTWMINELDVYNYEGYVWVTCEVQDPRGNWSEAEPVQLYIDNQAPDTPISQVSYRGPMEYDNYDPSPYQQWHELGTLAYEENNTITVAYNSLLTNEDAFLRMRVHQTEILNLSNYNIPPGQWSDLEMPITLYHAVGDAEHAQLLSEWNLFDHEPDPDGWFFFDLLMEEGMPRDMYFEPDTYHYFAFVAQDTRGNLEGDTEPALDLDYDISLSEFDAMWDLRVYLIADDPTFTFISAPYNSWVSEWINLGADCGRNDEMPSEMTFQWSLTGHPDEWNDIATVSMAYEQDVPYFIHIYRHELPQFKGWPFIPGIHIFNRFGIEIGNFNNIPVSQPYGNFDPDDGPEGAWYGYVDLPMGDNHGVYFIADLNDNGVIDAGDYGYETHPLFYHPNDTMYDDPEFYLHYYVSPYMTVLNTETFDTRTPGGVYYFRAVPDGDPRGAEVRPFIIDNTAPTAAIDIVGNDEDMPVFPVNYEVPFVTDIDDLIVYDEDFIMVTYQYSSTAPDRWFRQWHYIGETDEQEGDYLMEWPTVDPATDNIDNDGDQYVDEYDEANAYMYARSYAHDLAGNYGYSQEQPMIVDGSVAQMHIHTIDGIVPVGPAVVINIPEDGTLELVANDITEEFFDGAVSADFYYIAMAEDNGTRDSRELVSFPIELNVPVVDGFATAVWDLTMEEPERELLPEGYYILYVIAHDRVDNMPFMWDVVMTPIILNDTTGPEAYITSVGGRPMVDDGLFFANVGNYNGWVEITITNDPDVATVTLEYSVDGIIWHNINTVAYYGGDRGVLEIGWDLPYEEDMTYFLRAFVEDYQANDSIIPVTFYYDNLDPVLEVDPVITTVLTLNGQPVLDVLYNDVVTTLSYAVDANHGLYDVSNVNVTLMPIPDVRTGYTLGTNTYLVPGTTGDQFTVDLSNAVSDEYEVWVTLNDFAGNSATYNFFYLVIDVTAPTFDGCDLVHILTNPYQMPWNAVSDGSTIQFWLDVDDYMDTGVQFENDYFLGVETAVLNLTGDGLEDVVNGVFDVDGNITFDWTPADLADYLYQPINIALTLTDYYWNATTHNCNSFTLFDTEASQARIITVDDNMVDWQDEEYPDVTATGSEAWIDAYVPVSMDIAQYVRFEWFDGENWVVLGEVAWADAQHGVYPPYEYPLSDHFAWLWDISNLENGVHPIRAIAIDAAGFEMAEAAYIVYVNIENCLLEDILPVPYVWEDGEAATELVRGNFYDLTATSECPEMITAIEYLYRYVDENGQFVNDDIFSIGFDGDGEVPYLFEDWLIDHEMIPGLYVWIIAYPTMLNPRDVMYEITVQEMFDLGLYVELMIYDMTAPTVTALEFLEIEPDRDYNPLPHGFYINNTVTETIDLVTADVLTEYPAIWNDDEEEWMYMNDVLRVRLSYSDVDRQLNVLDDYWLDTDTEDNTNPYIYEWTNYGQGWDISMFGEGAYDMYVEAWDTAENLVTFMHTFHIDITAPFSALTITDMDNNPVDYLERGVTYLLHANAVDYEIFSYAYSYTVDGGTANAIPGDAPDVEFTVPEDINYGSLLEFTVLVTDMVGLTHQSSVARYIYDPETTEIIITHIGGVVYVPGLHINGSSVGLKALLLGNFEPDQITQVAFKYRYSGEDRNRDWILINEDAPVVQVNLQDNTAYTEWDVSELPEGMVEVGVVPVSDPENIFENPLWWATTEIDHTPPVMPAPVVIIPQYISAELRVEYATLPADINHGATRFEYAVYDQSGIPEAWNRIDVAPEYGYNGNWFFVLDLTDENGDRIAWFDDGQLYDFRLAVYDVAVDEPNMGLENDVDYPEGVLYDITDPFGFISQIDDEVMPFDEPVEVELDTYIDIYSIAFEMPGEYPEVSGIAGVDYFITIGENTYFLGEGEMIQQQDDHFMYWLQWPTTGAEIGIYHLFVVIYDNAGNEFESAHIAIKVVSNIDPIAYIAGFDFDAEIANLDHIYVVTEDCVDNPTDHVILEYRENEFSDWIPFDVIYQAQCMIIDGVKLWGTTFNANGMDVQMLRAMAVKTNGEYSERFAFLAVQYVEDEMYPDGYFIFPTNENVLIYYDDVVDIGNAASEPYALALNEVLDANQGHSVQLLDPIQTVDDPYRYTAPINICDWGINNIYGNMITVWTSYSAPYSENIEVITLENAQTRIYPITEANGSNGLIGPEFGMHVNVPLDGGVGHIYFEPLHMPNDYIPLPFDWVPLAPQVAIQGAIFPGTMSSDFNIAYEPDPYNNGNLFGARYVYNFWTHQWSWEIFPADEEGWFFAPLKTGIYTFIAVANVDLQVEYVTVSHEWWDGENNLWTQFEESCGGGERDLFGYGVDFEFKTYILGDDDRDYQVDPDVGIDVYLDEVKIVDNCEIDPEWVGAPIEVDPVSGIFHIVLIKGEYLEDEAEHILEVDVYKDGYEAEAIQPFWVDCTVPVVDNDGGGYIRHEMAISATIYDPETWIIEESIHVRLYNPEDVNNPEEHLIINYGSMEVTPVEYGFELSYTLTLDDLATVLCDDNDVNEVYVEWFGANNVDMLTYMGENVVVYVVDIAPPIVWAVSPVGDPLDNDGDGLFNEDPINGINDDLDFDDWNNNGIQDGMWVSDSSGTYWVGEPSLIDEDPIDFWPDTLLYGTDIVISVAYEDIPMPIMIGDEYCGGCEVYSGASGVDPEGIMVTLNGDIIEGFANNGVWQFDAGTGLDPGHYVVIASVPDMIGNVGSVSYEFEILGPAPSITFHQFIHNDQEVGWWYNPEWNGERAFRFTVHTLLPNTLAQDGVVATFYAMPDYILLQGPTTLTLPAGENDYLFEDLYLGSDIPADQYAVLLEVQMTNIWGDISVGSQSYGVDNTGPTVEIDSPEDDAEFEIGDAVHIIAHYFDVQEDEQPLRSTAKELKVREPIMELGNRTNGSGVSWALLTLVYPDGSYEEQNGGENYVEKIMTAEMPGQYSVLVVAEDMVGNSGQDNIHFYVHAPAPSIVFHPFGEAGFWFHPDNNEQPFEFVVTDDYGIPNDGVVVNFYAVPGGELLQGPQTLTPYSVAENEYTYHVNLGANVPAGTTGVILSAEATNIYGETTLNSQTYGIDMISPTVEIDSPEDGAEFDIGDVVHIIAHYFDFQEDERPTRNNTQITAREPIMDYGNRSNGSGIAWALLTLVYPDGSSEEIEGGENYVEHVITAAMPGEYSVLVVAEDLVGNSGQDNINFEVIATAPSIAFHPFGEAGFWFHPDNNDQPFEFVVTDEYGISNSGVVVNFYGVPSGDLLQGPQTLTPYSVEENVYTYQVNLGANIPDGTTGVMLSVEATNIYGQITMNSQTYGIDAEAPNVTFESPQPGQQFDVGAGVFILATFNDLGQGALLHRNANSMLTAQNDSRELGSGIADAELMVYDPFGNELEISVNETAQSISTIIVVNTAGNYTAVAQVTDNVGNVTVKTVNFEAVGEDPEACTIVFSAYGHNNWWGPEYNQPFEFTVTGDVAVNGIVASFYGMPAHDLLQGPQIVGSTAGTYQIYFNADISGEYDNLMLEVEATNIANNTTVNNETYGIDMEAPIVSVESPADGETYDLNEAVDVRAYVMDTESGIQSIVLKVDGSEVQYVLDGGIVYYPYPEEGYDTGAHTVEITASDFVYNMTVLLWTFHVSDANVEFEINEAYAYPNPIDLEEADCITFMVDTSKSSLVSVVVYDFAGNEVIKLKDSRSGAISWDCRTAKGTKLARGIYFAKVTANDGKKAVEKIVKIAIQG